MRSFKISMKSHKVSLKDLRKVLFYYWTQQFYPQSTAIMQYDWLTAYFPEIVTKSRAWNDRRNIDSFPFSGKILEDSLTAQSSCLPHSAAEVYLSKMWTKIGTSVWFYFWSSFYNNGSKIGTWKLPPPAGNLLETSIVRVRADYFKSWDVSFYPVPNNLTEETTCCLWSQW